MHHAKMQKSPTVIQVGGRRYIKISPLFSMIVSSLQPPSFLVVFSFKKKQMEALNDKNKTQADYLYNSNILYRVWHILCGTDMPNGNLRRQTMAGRQTNISMHRQLHLQYRDIRLRRWRLWSFRMF